MEEVQYIGFGKRFVAYMVDVAIIFVFTMVMSIIISVLVGGLSDESRGNMIIGLYTVSFLVYGVLMDSSSKQGTWGKMLIKAKIINKDGERLSVLNAVGRYFSRILSGMILCIGYFMIIFSKDKQGLHDKLAMTYVVKRA